MLVVLWSYHAHRWYFFRFPVKQAAVVYDVREDMGNLISQYGLQKKFNVTRVMGVFKCLADLSVLDSLDCVFLGGVYSHDRNIVIKRCMEIGVEALIIPRVGDVIMSGAQKMHLFHLPFLYVSRYNPKPEFVAFV